MNPVQLDAQYVNNAWRDQCVAEMEQRVMLQAAVAQLQAQIGELAADNERMRAKLDAPQEAPTKDRVNTRA